MTAAHRKRLEEVAARAVPLGRATASALRRIEALEKALADQIGLCMGCRGKGWNAEYDDFNHEMKVPCYACKAARGVLENAYG